MVNGAGASAQACTELFKNSGVKSENIIMLDRKGVIYEGRTEGIDQWKSKYSVKTSPTKESTIPLTSVLPNLVLV